MFDFDLADKVDDLICVFEGGSGDSSMDTLAMVMTGWLLFIIGAGVLLKVVYDRYRKKPLDQVKKTQDEKTQSSTVTQNGVNSSSGILDPKLAFDSRGGGPTAIRRRQRMQRSSRSSGSSQEQGEGTSESCVGPDPNVVEYVNECHSWLSSKSVNAHPGWEDVKDTFVDAVNKILHTVKTSQDSIFLSVVDVTLEEPIHLTNLFAESVCANNIKITCDCETKFRGLLSLYSSETGSRNVEFFVDRLSGRLNVLLDTGSDEELAITKFDGWPEICLAVSGSENVESLADRVTTAIRNAVIEIELRHFKTFPKAPQFSYSGNKSSTLVDSGPLLVKLIHGADLGLLKGCEEPYCVIELDEPPQRLQSRILTDHDPRWNENFVLQTVAVRGEIMFEVYDNVGTKFLGCNIVSVEDIREGQTRHLPLKSRRMETSDQFTGSVEVQFKFLNASEYNVLKAQGEVKESSYSNNKDLGQNQFSQNASTTNRNMNGPESIEVLRGSPFPSENQTLVIRPVKKAVSDLSDRPNVRIKRKDDGICEEADVGGSTTTLKAEENNSTGPEAGIQGQYGEERGRRRTRRGDIFTSIRRRFSKGRAHSAMSGKSNDSSRLESPDVNGDDLYTRSVSADRSSLSSGPGGRLGISANSTRSSTSELSGLSGHSTSTFVHESSTLVIECIENRVKRYYLVPPNLAETGKWKKRGKKLHIYNDHTFVAKRLASGTPCAVCFRRFPFSLGKQGYQCRDCKMTCHKECHIRAPSYCAQTSVYDIELGVAGKPKLGSVPNPRKSTSPNNSTNKSSNPFSEKCAAIIMLLSGSKENDTASTNHLPDDRNQTLPLENGGVDKQVLKNGGGGIVISEIKQNPKSGSRRFFGKHKGPKLNIFKKANKLGKISEEDGGGQQPTITEEAENHENEEIQTQTS